MHIDRIDSRTTLIVVLFALGLVFLFLHSIQPAQANVNGAIITVNSSADTSESGKCTLRDAIENANLNNGGHANCVAGSGADTIIFSSSLPTVTLNSLLPTITGILTLYGGQDAGKNQVISGKDSSGIFLVGPGASLTIDRMTLTHGKAVAGGAIAANSGSGMTVVISDSLLTRNQAEYDGGAISMGAGTTITVTKSKFSNNQTTYSYGEGGAILVGGTAYVQSDSYFLENSSAYGGALYGNTGAVVHLKDSRFEGNSASQSGGALYFSSTNLNMVNCDLYDNGSTTEGGAMYSSGGTATISDSLFDNNGIMDAPGSGGAIFSYSSNRLIIDNSTFHDNQADTSGGAIASNSMLTITNTSFNTNWVSAPNGYGGAVYLTNDGLTLAKARLESSTFYGNSAYKGAALENDSAVTQIINSTFNANAATEYGSAIDLYNATGAITVTHSTIAENSGFYAIYTYDPTRLTLRHSLISNNQGDNCSDAVVDGGYNLQFGGTDSDSCGSTIQVGDPQLGLLADNGGPTLTMLFQSAVAMNRIPGDAGCGIGVFNDQRGVPRPRATKCDIGAVENNMYLYLPAVLKSP
jgi:CSLREA domain-containing protein